MNVLAPGRLGDVGATYLLQEEFRTAQPYSHCIISPFCDRDFLSKVHDELTQHMKANFKETDLFKLFQTDELGTLDSKETKKTMPNLLKLREALYSKDFRDFVQQVTGQTDLTDRVDCSANAYANSCHLLCHDDVITTRRVSYVLYLSDPEEAWTQNDGGAVELYPLDPATVVFDGEGGGFQGLPTPHPSHAHLPQFNSLLL
ncbi:hypothetical protein EON64_14970, partial [archaeon]